MKITVFKIAPWAAAAAAVVLITALLVTLLGGAEETDVTRAGIAYLEEREQKDPNTVLQVLRDRRQAELEAQREELLRQIVSGETDPFVMFQDAVIMGDSRAVGFWYFGFVDQSRTLTGAGDTILEVHNQLDKLEAMNPSYIYLCYGLNDLKIGYWGSVERFVEKYMEYVGQIRARLPDTVVVISSMVPVQKDIYESATEQLKAGETGTPLKQEEKQELLGLQRLREVPAWNDALAAACAENDVIFVDNTRIWEEQGTPWEKDGIHMKEKFYPHWARNLVVSALEKGSSQVEEDNS